MIRGERPTVGIRAMRRLLLLRHAKSSWGDRELDDHDRPLAPRGEKAAARIGDYLAQRGPLPSLALCSSARRTRDTLERLIARLPEPPEVVQARELYLASVNEVLGQIRRAPDAHAVLLVVGHHPTTQALALQLSGRGDPQALRRLRAKFPTGALAELCFAAERWGDLEPGAGELHAFCTPKELG